MPTCVSQKPMVREDPTYPTCFKLLLETKIGSLATCLVVAHVCGQARDELTVGPRIVFLQVRVVGHSARTVCRLETWASDGVGFLIFWNPRAAVKTQQVLQRLVCVHTCLSANREGCKSSPGCSGMAMVARSHATRYRVCRRSTAVCVTFVC